MQEVRAATAQRQRRGQLLVAYGNALIGERGMGASEAMEAFARARDYVAGDKGAPERLAIHYGLWAGSFLSGELSAMREHVEAFFSDVVLLELFASLEPLRKFGCEIHCQRACK